MARVLDFTGCTFKWNWKGPRPPAIRHMVEDRAFKSFLADVDVMKSVWTEPTVNGKLENEVFPREKGVDICCADTVGWCAYQTRAIDFLVVSGMNVHWVDTYFPFKKTVHGQDFAKLVAVYGPDDQAAGLDDTNFLPGDYFIYCRIFDWIAHGNHKHPPAQRIADALAGEEGKVETVGDHINMWLGPFAAYDPDGNLIDDHFDQINGSYGTTGSSHYVLPVNRRQYWTGYEWKLGTYVAHCRFKAIERLFRDVLGPPMRAPPLTNVSTSGPSKGKKPSSSIIKPGPSDDLDAFWTAIRDAEAPYPVGTHMGWHQGVHVKLPAQTSEDDRVDDVYSMAPGQVVAVRGASPGLKEGDASFVLLKHLLGKKDRQVVDPTAKSGGAGGIPPQPFFSLYMHLAPLAAFFGEKKEGDTLPPLRDSAPAWLRALWPRPLPTGVVANGTLQTLLAPKGGDPANGWVSLGAPPNLKLGGDVPVDKLTKVTADGVDYYVIPQSGDTAAAAWVARPTPPAAKGELLLFNPRTGKVLRTHTTLDGSAHLFVAPDPADGTKQRLDVQTVDGAEYARIDLYPHPALRRTGRANDFTTASAPVDGRGDLPDAVLVLPPKASKGDAWDLYLTTTVTDGKPVVKGPTVPLKFADVVDADAEQTRKQDEPDDTTTHTTVGIRDPVVPTGDADAGKKIGWLWLDLVACVKLTKSKADIESALNDDQVRIQRGVADRLAAGTSRLLGAVASTADDAAWSLEADGYTLDGSSSSDPPPALYATVKARGRGFTVDTGSKQKAADGTWKLSPPGAAGASVHAVDVTPGATKGTTAALVEVVYGVKAADVDAATKKVVDAVKSDNDKRKGVIDDLTTGKVIDLRNRVLDPVFVGREPIGAFGKLIAPLGTPGTDRGIHVEVFSGKPLALPADASIPDKTLQPLAGSPWLALKDTSADDSLGAKAARLLVKELSAHGGAGFAGGVLPVMPPAGDSDPWQPPTRDEWLTFCKAHERALARVVSVHPSEWSLDWPESASKDGSTFVFQTDGAGDAVKNVHTSLAWTKGPGAFKFTSDDGISDDTAIVFHHPARLLELLRTGIEVTVAAQKSGAAGKAKVTYTPSNEAPITLPALEGGGRYGSLIETSEVIETTPSITGTLDVAFDGGSPPPLKFEGVRVVRGASTRYSVVAAYVETATEWPHAKKSYALDYSEGPPREHDSRVAEFLADGGAYLAEDGYGRVHLRVSAHYNVAVPKFEDPTLGDGSKGFTIDKATIKRFPDAAKSPAAAPDDPAQPTSVTASVTYIEFDVVGKPKDVGVTETVSVKVSGDELGGPQTVTWKLVTRVIEPATGKAHVDGADVAQLQLYLALILGADGLPCYRSDPDDKTTAAIDGNYGPKLRAALFRFCYAYVGAKGWVASSLQLKKGKTLGDSATVQQADLLADATKIHAGLADKATVEAHDARVSDKGGDEWIVIDLLLVKSVVGVFGAGHAVPQAEILAAATAPPLPTQAADGPAVSFVAVKDGWARGMAWPDFRVYCALVGDTSQGVDASGQIELKLPDGAPYTLSQTGATGSATLTTTAGTIAPPKGFGFELVTVPGMHWTGKEPAQLTATWKGGRNWQISQRHFQEPRDFTQKWDPDQAGTDVTLVQFCLSQATHKAPAGGGPPAPRGFIPPPVLKKGQKAPATPPPRVVTVDGVWTTAWVKALKDYATEWGLPFKSDVVTKLLAHVLKGVPPGP